MAPATGTRTTDPAAKFYRTWQKRIVQEWQPEIPKARANPRAADGGRNHRPNRKTTGPTKTSATDVAVLKAVAIAIALHGNYGRHCYVSDATIGAQLARSRWTIRRYRELLIDFGAFADNGPHGRTRDLSIAMPADTLPAAVGSIALPLAGSVTDEQPLMVVEQPQTAVVACTCTAGNWPGEDDWCDACQSERMHSRCPAGCPAADSPLRSLRSVS